MSYILALVLCVCWQPNVSAQQLARSSAISKTITKAQQALESGQAEAISKSVIALESLLREPSGFRMEIDTKICTVLLLSSAYETLYRYEDQELMLRKFSKLPELSRYTIQLRTALARSLFQQIRFEEADQIITELCSVQCSALSLEEKNEIAQFFAFRNEFIRNALGAADHQCDQYRFEEALAGYRNILPILEKLTYPSGSSRVEKKRIRDMVLLRIAEVLFCLQEFEESHLLASKVDSRLFLCPQYQPLHTRKLALLSLLTNQMKDQSAHNYASEYLDCSLFKAPNMNDFFLKKLFINSGDPSSLLLFQAKEAYTQHSQGTITAACTVLQTRNDLSKNLFHILKGLAASLVHNYPEATQELLCGLKHPMRNLEKPFRECALAELAKCSLARLLLISFCQDSKQANEMVLQLTPILRTSQNPQTLLQSLAIEVFFSPKIDIAYVRSILDSIIASNLYYDKNLHEVISRKISNAEHSSEPFAISELLDESYEEDKSGSNRINPVFMYATSRSSYLQSINDEFPIEKAQAQLNECLAEPGLKDVKPQILCQLTELALHAGQYAQASEYLHELIDSFPLHPSLSQTAFSSLIAFESDSNTETDRNYIATHLLTKTQPDIHSYLTLLHLFENYNQIFSPPSEPLILFQQALIAREEARNYAFESTQCTEPGTAKMYIEQLLASYNKTIGCLQSSIQKTCDMQCRNFLYAVLFKMHEEKILPLLHHMESLSAFNELPQQLLSSAEALQENLEKYRFSIQDASRLLSDETLNEITLLSMASNITVCTFRRDLQSALLLAQKAPSLHKPTAPLLKSYIYLSKMLREAKLSTESLRLFDGIDEIQLGENYELLLELAIEKSLCLQELDRHDQAMATLGWVINSQYPSSLRIKAMILRAEMYLSINRRDLATRQLEAVQSKGGEWAKVADRKLKELYGNN